MKNEKNSKSKGGYNKNYCHLIKQVKPEKRTTLQDLAIWFVVQRFPEYVRLGAHSLLKAGQHLAAELQILQVVEVHKAVEVVIEQELVLSPLSSMKESHH